jgi:hypothetical protein
MNLMKSLIFINSIWITISYFCINVLVLTNGRFKVLFDQGPWNLIGDSLEPTEVTMSSNCWLEPRELVAKLIILDIHQMFFYQSMWGLHSSDIRNTSIFWRCSKRSIFKYFKKIIIIIQRLENWPLYQVFSSIFLKAQKNVKYAYVWIELRVCHYYGGLRFCLIKV